MSKALGTSKVQSIFTLKNIQIVVLAAFLLSFALLILNHQSTFPDKWFPSYFSSSLFMFLLCLWIVSEFVNNLWSAKNSQKTNKDKGSYRIIIASSYALLFIVFISRGLEIWTFNGDLQYVGFILIFIGILLREWSIWVLGKHFTVRVQVRDNAKLVTEGPYKYIRHPAYTGNLLTFIGIPLAIGTWIGIIVAIIVKFVALQYRIRIEEQALREAFGYEYEEYKKRTWKLFPGF